MKCISYGMSRHGHSNVMSLNIGKSNNITEIVQDIDYRHSHNRTLIWIWPIKWHDCQWPCV